MELEWAIAYRVTYGMKTSRDYPLMLAKFAHRVNRTNNRLVFILSVVFVVYFGRLIWSTATNI